uniref:NACHT, LRR and PYD domains-containing protein 3 n=1 Tax=Accipiter nisus TaxID=211598 RepID=A0A8B9N928_9AVES
MGLRGSRDCGPSRDSSQGTAGELLLRALEDLSELDFKKFRDALAHGDVRGRTRIPWGRLEKADWTDTKNLMLDFYGGEDALDVAIAVFEHIQLRNAAALLRESREKGGKAERLPSEYSILWGPRHHVLGVVSARAHIMKEQASSSIAVSDLFKPGPDGWTPKVVVLLGAAGVGKTMTARKIMLDWASNRLFVEFDYVFYIHCREGNLLTSPASVANLISQCYPGSSPPLDEILRQQERLLFVIDGFDEFRFSFDLPKSELCFQPQEERPVEIILSSLFRRMLLPKCSLLITTRPAALQKLGKCLECERYAEILGFSEAERKEYFHKFFDNAEQAAAAFQFVRGNETLFTMCLVPIVCWIVCTVMKQQLGHTGGLAQSLKTTTRIYVLYLSALLRSLRSQLKQGMPRVLRKLCCLAADGIWKQKVLFEEKEVQGYALDQLEALPLLLNEHLFQKDISCVSTYSFIHLSFQEFFAALFYLLEDEGEAQDLPAGPSRDVKELLENYGNSRNYFMLTVRFLFGLLNEEHRRELEEEMGCKITPRITQELLAWLQNSQKTALALLMEETAVIRELEVCHCLYELQDKRFVAAALDPFTGVYLRGLNLNRFDQLVLSFSIKHFPKLESLDLGHCSFLWDDPEDSVGPQPAKQEGKQSPIHPLCQALEKSGCKLKMLRLGCCNLTATGCKDLAAVLGTMSSLAQLDLSDNPLEDSGMRELCGALAGPGCSMQKLWLWQCRLTEASCGALAAVLAASPSLTELHLGANELGDGGVRRLCEGLRDPACRLQMLSLWQCRLTGACCKDLCTVLSTSRSLEHLDLSENDLGDGCVQLLCETLRHPTSFLQRLWLKKSGLNEETLQKLAALKDVNPNLNIQYV